VGRCGLLTKGETNWTGSGLDGEKRKEIGKNGKRIGPAPKSWLSQGHLQGLNPS
jgi:hypothetical protein